jgi:hypothetical protein
MAPSMDGMYCETDPIADLIPVLLNSSRSAFPLARSRRYSLVRSHIIAHVIIEITNNISRMILANIPVSVNREGMERPMAANGRIVSKPIVALSLNRPVNKRAFSAFVALALTQPAAHWPLKTYLTYAEYGGLFRDGER